jgi:hypothetical protein
LFIWDVSRRGKFTFYDAGASGAKFILNWEGSILRGRNFYFFSNFVVYSVLPIFAFEFLPPKDRIWISCVFGGHSTIIITSLLAYFSGDWRTLARAISVLVIPAFILCW